MKTELYSGKELGEAQDNGKDLKDLTPVMVFTLENKSITVKGRDEKHQNYGEFLKNRWRMWKNYRTMKMADQRLEPDKWLEALGSTPANQTYVYVFVQ